MPDPFTPKFVDLVRNFTTTTGTGNIVLGTAVSGHASLAGAVAVGERFFYCILGIDKPAEREVGRGTMTANGTVAREPISGLPTSFTSGTKTIALVAAAEWFRTLGQMVNGGSDSLAALATTNKTSLLAAVNEVSAAAAAALGGGGAGAADVLFVAAGGSAVPAIRTRVETAGYSVASEGRAAYVYDAAVNAAFVAANPRTAFLAADGRGFRLDSSQRLTIDMFGAVKGGTMAANGANNHAAITAAIMFKPLAVNSYTPIVHWPIGIFYVNATLNGHGVVHWIGSGSGANSGPLNGIAGTRITAPINTTVYINHSSNTNEAGSTAVNKQLSGYGSIFFGLSFEQETQGTSATAYGFWMRGMAQLIQCSVRNVASHAYYMNCTATAGGLLEGDCNNWLVDHCFVHTCGGNALHIQGQDANAGLSVHLVTAGNTIDGCAIYDRSALGCTHINPQCTGYGNTGVFHLGSFYQFIGLTPGEGSTTTPGTNLNIWYPLRTAAAASATFPQWVNGGTYIHALPLFIIGPSAVHGGYQEFGQVAAHCPGAAIFGAPFVFTTTSNAIKPLVNGGGLAAISGIGTYRGSGSDTATPEYADEGAYSYTMLGTKDLQTGDITKRPNILQHQTQQDGSFSMAWHWDNKNQVLRYLNQKPMWSFGGPGTARTYGRDTTQPYYFTLHDFAIQDATNSNNLRIMGLRAAAPTTGNHAQGEFFFSVTPTATGTLGWSCTTAGTPGTWTPVAVAGFGGTYTAASNFGDLTIGSGVDGRVLFVTNTTGHGLRAFMNANTNTLYLSNQLGSAATFAGFNLRGNPIVLNHNNTEVARSDAAGFDVTGRLRATGEILSSSPTAGVGYRAGAGGVITQATSKSTGVTLNTAAGQITLSNASLAAGASVSFTLTNSAIAVTDVPIISIRSGASTDSYETNVTAVAAGSCRIQLRNQSAAALAEALVLNFAVFKAVAA